ncbi:hypothetical protein CF70_006265 [Cupriavidus sp. SK-3]|nr:hypothetical protein CF70_006265 [Cupriavidus sp. SK-3]
MKRLAAWLLLSVAPLSAYAAMTFLHSRSAVVYDVDHDQVLLEKNPDDVAPLASLTKLMTAMMVLDQDPALDEALNVDSADIDQIKHSSSRIPIGVTLTRREMLRLALMASENRSASALSRATAGGQPAFVEKMNKKASELGMLSTHFEEPTGLSPRNLSSARDIVRMANAASHYPLILEFTTLSRYGVEVGGRMLLYRNSSPMINRPGWDIQLSKTGFINEAGYCIVLEVNMQNGPVIIVLMGAASRRMRSADLISIRNWLEGKAAPGATLQAAYPSRPVHRHKAKAVLHKGKFQLGTDSTRSASKAQGPGAKRKAGTRHHGGISKRS